MKFDKKQLKKKSYDKHDIIINEGIRNDYVYFLTKGDVEIVRYSIAGDEEIIYTQHSPSIFGEVELFSNNLPSFNVTAKTDVEVLICSKDAFINYMCNDKDFLEQVYTGLINKLLHSSKKQLDYYRKPLKERVEYALNECAQNGTLDTLTKRELCQKVSAPLRSVNRVLHDVEGYAYIEKRFLRNK